MLAAVPTPFDCQWKELPSTVDEVKTISGTIPASALLALPMQEDVTLGQGSGLSSSTLLDKLPDATILHLACHGFQDHQSPLKSGFIMSDEILTIEKLIPIPLPRAFLAFLSACETAKGHKVSYTQNNNTCDLFSSVLRTSRIKPSISPRLCYLLGSRVSSRPFGEPPSKLHSRPAMMSSRHQVHGRRRWTHRGWSFLQGALGRRVQNPRAKRRSVCPRHSNH
jgi:hypothetical protein